MPSPSRQPDGTFSHLDPRGGSADEAARIAAFGGLVGAMKWGISSVLAGLVLHQLSPIFRGLTPQFKVYLLMCPMTVGGMTEADRRLRRYELRVRMNRRDANADSKDSERY